jgi:solute carrier family 45 protein 1/2/4
MAAPICGAVVQPIVGAISDRSQSSWGRRRPFIVWGTALSVISMLSLAWCTQVVGMFPIASETCRRNWVLAFAMVSVYVLNIAVQPIQLGLRTLVIECCPQHQQSQASSWASYSIGIGSIAGYAAASSDLPFLFNCDWISQFQYLVILASAALVITVGVTCLSVVEEQSSTMTNLEAPALLGILAMPRSLLTTLKELPLRIRRICHIQFFAWLAWFPVLYYGAE